MNTMFKSIISEYIDGLISEKRSLGFDYRTEEKILLRFDQYCIKHKLGSVSFSRDFLSDWCSKKENEGNRNHTDYR